jgi:hypothetical protein
MDALPPPVAHESRTMPVRRAPNHAHPEQKPRTTVLAARGGIGLGFGTFGVAAHKLAQAELFPLPFLGLGVETEGAGSTELGWLEPVDYDEVSAVRGRLVWRIPSQRFSFVGALAIGRAEVSTIDEYDLSSNPECDSLACSYIGETTRDDVTVSAVLELGGRFQWSVVELGGHLRIDVSPPAVLVTTGPTLGLAF